MGLADRFEHETIEVPSNTLAQVRTAVEEASRLLATVTEETYVDEQAAWIESFTPIVHKLDPMGQYYSNSLRSRWETAQRIGEFISVDPLSGGASAKWISLENAKIKVEDRIVFAQHVSVAEMILAGRVRVVKKVRKYAAAHQRCNARLKTGANRGQRCAYKATVAGYCGIHKSLLRSEIINADRDTALALKVSVGLALIHLMEKAIEYIPDAIDVLGKFFGSAGPDFHPGYDRYGRTQYLQLLREEILADGFFDDNALGSIHEVVADSSLDALKKREILEVQELYGSIVMRGKVLDSR